MARVNVEQKALTDPRFGRLALELVNAEYPDISMDTAQCLGVGRMIRIWNECQERNSYTLADHDLVVLLGNRNAAQILIDCGLGERERRGVVRIKGTVNRIEWLENKRLANRENGKKGGRPPKPKPEPKENHSGLPQKTPPAPAPALKEKEEKETETSRGREAEPGETPSEKPAQPEPASIVAPDFAAAQRVISKLEHCALKSPPPDQIAIAWVTEYDVELIEETLADCEDAYRGKGWQYFEKILTTRRDDPSQRPGNRRAKGNGNGSATRNAGQPATPPAELPHYDGEPVVTDEMRERWKQLRPANGDLSKVVVSSKRKIVPKVPETSSGGS